MDNLPNDEYSLVPAFDNDGKETGYYTREPDGISGMTISALSEFCGLAAGSTSAVSNLLKQIEQSSPETNTLSEALKSLTGKALRLETNDLQGRLIVPDEVCQAVIEYYAFESRDYAGRDVAIANYRAVARAGIRVFIWTKTGFYPEALRSSLKSNTTVYIERLENIRDHKVPDDLWTTFREGAEILLLVEKEMGVPIEQMDLCDGSIGKHWSLYREGKPWCKPSGYYTHFFRDVRGEINGCKAYDLAELSYFRKWLRDFYVPYHLPKYLSEKHGKLAIRQVYEEMGGLTERILEVTEIKKMTEKQQLQHQEFRQLRKKLMPGFQPQYRIEE